MSDWTFITKHGQVLLAIAKSQGKTAREIGNEVGITERTVHKMIKDLEEDGYIIKTKVGNKNTYRIRPEVPIKISDIAVGELLEALGWKRRGRKTAAETYGNSERSRGSRAG